MSAIFQSGLTKLGSNNASKMSANVIGKGITSGLVAGLGVSTSLGIKSFAQNSWEAYNKKIATSGSYYWSAS